MIRSLVQKIIHYPLRKYFAIILVMISVGVCLYGLGRGVFATDSTTINWSTTAQCSSSNHTFTSRAEWGPVVSNKRTISSVTLEQPTAQGLPATPVVTYNIYIQYRKSSTSKWITATKIDAKSPTTGAYPITKDPTDPPAKNQYEHRIYINVKSTKNKDISCNMIHSGIPPNNTTIDSNSTVRTGSLQGGISCQATFPTVDAGKNATINIVVVTRDTATTNSTHKIHIAETFSATQNVRALLSNKPLPAINAHSSIVKKYTVTPITKQDVKSGGTARINVFVTTPSNDRVPCTNGVAEYTLSTNKMYPTVSTEPIPEPTPTTVYSEPTPQPVVDTYNNVPQAAYNTTTPTPSQPTLDTSVSNPSQPTAPTVDSLFPPIPVSDAKLDSWIQNNVLYDGGSAMAYRSDLKKFIELMGGDKFIDKVLRRFPDITLNINNQFSSVLTIAYPKQTNNRVEYNKTFWDSSPDRRVPTLIHEYVHVLELYDYFYVPNYRAQREALFNEIKKDPSRQWDDYAMNTALELMACGVEWIVTNERYDGTETKRERIKRIDPVLYNYLVTNFIPDIRN